MNDNIDRELTLESYNKFLEEEIDRVNKHRIELAESNDRLVSHIKYLDGLRRKDKIRLQSLRNSEEKEMEIELLRESCRRREDKATESSALARKLEQQNHVLANAYADQKREIERLKKYADALHEDKMNALLEVHKIREALNGVLFAEKS